MHHITHPVPVPHEVTVLHILIIKNWKKEREEGIGIMYVVPYYIAGDFRTHLSSFNQFVSLTSSSHSTTQL